jgi:hypothetical protein
MANSGPTVKQRKWILPAGIAASLVLLAACIALVLYFVSALMKSSDVYQQAVAIARADPQVTQALGLPIEEGFFASGSIETSGPSGKAALAIPVSGSKGSGTIFLEARESVGEWSFSKLVFEVDGSRQRMNLLEPRAASATNDH